MQIKKSFVVASFVIAALCISKGVSVSAVFNNRIVNNKGFCTDTTKLSSKDSLVVNDSTAIADSIRRQKDSLRMKGSLTIPVFSTARDSIVEDFSDGNYILF